MIKIIKYVLHDIFRNRILMAYGVLLSLSSFGLFLMNEDVTKGLSSLLTVLLIVVPLVSILFTTIYIFNSYEFIELLVAQPLKRSIILFGLYAGVGISLLAVFWIGIGLPAIIFDGTVVSWYFLLSGSLLTVVFVSLAFLASVVTRDKTRGIGISILLWFYFSLIFDGILLMVMFAFSDYPLEKLTILISCLNPIDLARIMVLLKMDISALMGYTGAVFNQFFGSSIGIIVSVLAMLTWVIIPIGIALRVFKEKNL
ncbi:MAG: ABC transporter permease subunit [Bacteroidales bacterium]|nr:ABC transporter permease subunit [Bacteroidales bacterium]